MRSKVLALGLAGVVALLARSADAAIVTCPEPSPLTTMTLDSPLAASCGPTLNGVNIQGDNDDFSGYTFIDKENQSNDPIETALSITGINATSGTFAINFAGLSGYSSLLLAFKTGSGQNNPDVISFVLTPTNGVVNGSWTIQNPPNATHTANALSHANLYGVVGERTNTAVPEPASLLLLGSGLAYAGSRARKRKK